MKVQYSEMITEENNNEALRGFENPDPSDVYDLWMAPEQ